MGKKLVLRYGDDGVVDSRDFHLSLYGNLMGYMCDVMPVKGSITVYSLKADARDRNGKGEGLEADCDVVFRMDTLRPDTLISLGHGEMVGNGAYLADRYGGIVCWWLDTCDGRDDGFQGKDIHGVPTDADAQEFSDCVCSSVLHWIEENFGSGDAE